MPASRTLDGRSFSRRDWIEGTMFAIGTPMEVIYGPSWRVDSDYYIVNIHSDTPMNSMVTLMFGVPPH
jgi:hypothetical protein